MRDLINECKAVVDISTDKLNQETSKLSSETDEKIHGNQKLQCQWRPGKFYRTKKLNSVKKSIQPYPDLAKQKKKIKDSLKVGQTFNNNLVKNSVDFLSIETPRN